MEDSALILKKGTEILFSSNKKHLRPLVECVNKFKDKAENCILYDKIVGLAAAKLIAYSGFVTKVYTDVISDKAGDYLADNAVLVEPGKIVDRIMNEDKTDQCPMEKKAEEMKEEEFIEFCRENFGLSE